MPALLELKNLSVDFSTPQGILRAVDDASLAIEPGEFISIVGPSGCGKSTLLNVMGGFIEASGGEALYQGQPLQGPSRHRGVVFQKPSLYPWLNVIQNVEFGLRMQGLPRQKRRKIARDKLHRVKLGDFESMRPYELSGGMQQRVAIARVLATNPEMLLMDEPFGALDVLTREHLQEELLALWKENHKTVVFITHSVEEAIYLSTSVYVMGKDPGRLIRQIDTPFSTGCADLNSRQIKSLPEFVELREEVLSSIWK